MLKNVGVGLRAGHYDEFLSGTFELPFLEAVSENFIHRGGRARAVLEKARESSVLFLHGVGLSLGSVDPISRDYLRGLRELVDDFEPAVVSDHLCFGTWHGNRAYDLWPLPHTTEAVGHVAARIFEVQDYLKRPIAVENISSYLRYSVDQLAEWQFLSEILDRTGGKCLFDINNVYVNSRNFSFSAKDFVDHFSGSEVAYIHLAGHSDLGHCLLDDHSSAVCTDVWELYRYAIGLWGPKPTIIERDGNLPPLQFVIDEAVCAEVIIDEICAHEAGV